MTKSLLFFLLLITFFTRISSQVLYSSTTEFGNRYNPGISKAGTPNVLFDDVSVANSLVDASDSFTITKVKVGIRRVPNAAATDVQIYYTIPDDTSTMANTAIKIPPVLLGTVSLPANGPSLVTAIVSVGDSVSALCKIKTDTSRLYAGYQTFFIGTALTNADNSNGIRFTSGPPINQDLIWIYNSDSSGSRFASNFGGNPPATFYIQVFGAPSSVLPITLSKFTGERKSGVNLLTWITETEANSKGYEIERSADGTNYSSIDFVNSKAVNGNSSATLTYHYSDLKPFAGKTWYRLRQVDKDGRSSLSNIVLLRGEISEKLALTNVYPNPAKAVLNVLLATPVSEKVNVVVTDFMGRIMLQQSSKLIAGGNPISINVSKLSQGNYVIKAVDGNGNTTISHFIKE